MAAFPPINQIVGSHGPVYDAYFRQDTKFLCKVCGDQYFKARYDVTRHIEEQHGGFSYKCLKCFKLYNRQGTHARCLGTKHDMVLFHRESGAREEAAQQRLEEYYRTKLPYQWEAVPYQGFVPGQRDSRHAEPPSAHQPPQPPQTHKSPLDGLYPTAKRNTCTTASTSQKNSTVSKPDKAPLTVTRYIDDFTGAQDPDIQIMEPVEGLFQDVDPLLKNVIFEPPTRISTPTASFLSLSSSSESSDSDSDSEMESANLDNRVVQQRKRKHSNEQVNELSPPSKRTVSNLLTNDSTENHENRLKNENVKKSLSETNVVSGQTAKNEQKVHVNEKATTKEKQTSINQSGNEKNVENESKSSAKSSTNEPKSTNKCATSESKSSVKTSRNEPKSTNKCATSESKSSTTGKSSTNEPKSTNKCATNESKSTTKSSTKEPKSTTKSSTKEPQKATKSSTCETQNEQPSEAAREPCQASGNFEYLDDSAIGWMEKNWNRNLYYNLNRLFTTLRYENEQPRVMSNIAYKSYNTLQEGQESPIHLEIGGQIFITNKVTLKADPSSLLGMLFRRTCPMRPIGGNLYRFDRDPTHFNYILNFLRNGGHLDLMTLPQDKKSLLELLTECRFYCLKGLGTIVLDRLEFEYKSRNF